MKMFKLFGLLALLLFAVESQASILSSAGQDYYPLSPNEAGMIGSVEEAPMASDIRVFFDSVEPCPGGGYSTSGYVQTTSTTTENGQTVVVVHALSFSTDCDGSITLGTYTSSADDPGFDVQAFRGEAVGEIDNAVNNL